MRKGRVSENGLDGRWGRALPKQRKGSRSMIFLSRDAAVPSSELTPAFHALFIRREMNTDSAGIPGPLGEGKRGRTLAATRIFDLHSVGFRHPGRGTETRICGDRLARAGPTVVAAHAGRAAGAGAAVSFRPGRFFAGDSRRNRRVPARTRSWRERASVLREETGFAGVRARLPRQRCTRTPRSRTTRCHLILIEDAEQSQGTAFGMRTRRSPCRPRRLTRSWLGARDGRITHRPGALRPIFVPKAGGARGRLERDAGAAHCTPPFGRKLTLK